MNIYTLERTDAVGYDEVRSFVIVASDTISARELAVKHRGDEPAAVWSNAATSVIKRQGRASKGFGPKVAGGPNYLLSRDMIEG